jgi:O-acetyl-ADP-ribose deacetylase (regulator of RNase III)
MTEAIINGCLVRVLKDDITALDIDAFVFNARPDLVLGAGFGTAIALRGGPSIQAELKTLGPLDVGQAVVTAGGKLKAKHIIHVVGPRFQEENLEHKLAESVRSALRAAEARGIARLALPPLGVGFYGVPLDTCARVMISELRGRLAQGSGLQEVLICVRDTHEIAPFEREIRAAAALQGDTQGRTSDIGLRTSDGTKERP